jgi:hypothetical protein
MVELEADIDVKRYGQYIGLPTLKIGLKPAYRIPGNTSREMLALMTNC